MGWKKVLPSYAGSTGVFGGDDINKISDMFSGVLNVDTVDINSVWTFRSGMFQIANTTNTQEYKFVGSAITADRIITIPALSADGNMVITSMNNLFSVDQWFNNNIAIIMRDNGAVNRQVMKIDAANNFLVGSTAGTTNTYIYCGNATEAFKIDSSRLVQTSPVWAVSLVLNNNLAYQQKDSGGTTVNLVRLSSTNNFIVGTSVSLADIELFAGNVSAAMVINNSNVVTTSPVWGAIWVQNNNLGIQMKDSGGTARTLVYMSGGNLFSIGDLGNNGYNTSIWAGSATAAIQLTNTNQATFTKMSQTGVAETLATWKVSDDASSVLEILNSTSTDANFLPWIRAKALGTISNVEALIVDAQVLATLDTGTTSCFRISSRRSDGTAIQSRDLISFQNAGTIYFGFKANAQSTFTKTAETGIAEIVTKFTVSDDINSSLVIENVSASDTVFAPRITGSTSTNHGAGSSALYLKSVIQSANDSGTAPAMLISFNNQAGAQVAVRPLIDFQNLTTSVFKINAKGDILSTIISQTGAAETVAEFRVSDSAGTSYFRIANFSAVDAVFAPRLLINNADSADPIELLAQIAPAQDTGANAVFDLTIRRNDNTVIATRPIFRINNRGNSLYTINPTGVQHQFTALAIASTAEVIASYTISDDTGATIQIKNGFSTDAVFAPLIQCTASALAPTNVPALFLYGSIRSTADSGSVPGMVFNVFLHTSANIAVRPLFDFRNNGTTTWRMNANGDIAHTILSQTGVAETLAKWIVSDVTNGWIRFDNAVTTDSVFIPTITLRADGASASSNVIISETVATQDTGTNPVLTIQCRTHDATGALANRAVLQIQNYTNVVFKMNVFGDVAHTIMAQTGVAETLYEFKVADASSYLRFFNGSSTDARFAATIRGRQIEDQTIYALRVEGAVEVAHDTGTAPVMIFMSQQQGGTDITTRPLYDFRNNATSVFKINAKGDVLRSIISQASAAEVLEKYVVSDDAASYMQFDNNSAVDATYAPRIIFNYGKADALQAGGYQMFIIPTAQDSGTVPAAIFESRLTSAAQIATRPLFDFRSVASSVFKINAKGDVVQTIIAQTGVGELLHTWTTSDADGNSYLRIYNASSTDAVFAPKIIGSTSTASVSGLYVWGWISAANDSGTVPIIQLDTRRYDATAITTRPLVQISNLNVAKFEFYNAYMDFKNNEIRNVVGSSTMSEIEGWQTNKRTGHLYGGNTVNAEFGVGLLAPKGLGFYGTAMSSGMYGNGGVFTGINGTFVNANGVSGYKCGCNIRRDRQIKLAVKARIDRQSASRFFIILKSNSTQLTAGTQTPLATNEGGIAIGWNELNGNYRVWTCDALGTVTNTDTGVAVPAWNNDAERLELEVDSAGTTWTWRIYSVTNTLLGSNTVTTTVPTISHIFSFHIHGEITDSTVSTFLIWSADMEALK